MSFNSPKFLIVDAYIYKFDLKYIFKNLIYFYYLIHIIVPIFNF